MRPSKLFKINRISSSPSTTDSPSRSSSSTETINSKREIMPSNEMTSLCIDDSFLDTIDKLRGIGLQDYIPLPQIAVVGDQSSGKSTLLEYISGVTFPKDPVNTCTCFVTEVTMRRDVEFSATVLLNNNLDPRLGVPTSADTVVNVIEQAKEILRGSRGNEKGKIYDDTLTVRLFGPNLPSLTLVDLPGYIQTHAIGQPEDSVEKIQMISEKYLKSESTTILAVIPANQDFETNEVVKHIRKFDGNGERTLCVLTKPDLVDRGTEDRVIETLSGSKMALACGYHIVRNKGYEDCQAGVSREATARKEANFFAHPPWSKVDPSDRGIERLVQKLTEILTSRVEKEFPGIRKRIIELKEEAEKKLASLGPGLETDLDKILLVHQNVAHITRQLKYLVDGQYSAVVFNDELYIRASVQQFNRDFRRDILAVTHASLEDLDVASTMTLCRGRELNGMIQFDPFVVLYRNVCCKWYAPTKNYIDRVCGEVQTVSRQVIKNECPKILLDYFLERMQEFLDQRKQQILNDMNEILEDESTPFTCQLKLSQFATGHGTSPTPCIQIPTRDEVVMRQFLKNYCNISTARYVDAICLYAVERNLFKKCDKFITDFFDQNKRNLSRIRESAEIKSLRDKLPKTIAMFQEALNEF